MKLSRPADLRLLLAALAVLVGVAVMENWVHSKAERGGERGARGSEGERVPFFHCFPCRGSCTQQLVIPSRRSYHHAYPPPAVSHQWWSDRIRWRAAPVITCLLLTAKHVTRSQSFVLLLRTEMTVFGRSIELYRAIEGLMTGRKKRPRSGRLDCE
jgi:hypothetical protein